jgi:hypothetical protein
MQQQVHSLAKEKIDRDNDMVDLPHDMQRNVLFFARTEEDKYALQACGCDRIA